VGLGKSIASVVARFFPRRRPSATRLPTRRGATANTRLLIEWSCADHLAPTTHRCVRIFTPAPPEIQTCSRRRFSPAPRPPPSFASLGPLRGPPVLRSSRVPRPKLRTGNARGGPWHAPRSRMQETSVVPAVHPASMPGVLKSRREFAMCRPATAGHSPFCCEEEAAFAGTHAT
jgi:hypothetical protein